MEMTDGRAVIQVCDTCRNYVVTMYLIHMDLKLAVEKVRPAFVKKDGFKDLVYTAPTERTYVKRKRVPKKKSLG
jgi:hypothetical protein